MAGPGKSSRQYIQNCRVISTWSGNTATSPGSCAARKQGRIASPRPCCAATYWAITLVLRRCALAFGNRLFRYSSSELNARSST
ncbi:hypothetical protein COLO4_00596 [Corchorus olitorius]|uniref:Uncharacterized protein n=1 Tax=Corchorus olitorius TaxID=93759 RepID=A0A1R3L3L1_9ROSI|nr:hypothetical protein COLO4_00596 [Corchorus olitorius]